MRRRVAVVFAGLIGAGLAAVAEEKPPEPDASLVKSVEALQAATREVLSLQAEYVRNYSVYGRSGFITEKGTLSWRRTPEGVVSARWEGKDEKGPILTLIKDRQATLWRGNKREAAIALDDPATFHVARFDFPLVPRDWQTAFLLGGPRTSPEFDDRFPERSAKGLPSCLTFSPRSKEQRMSFKTITLLFDEQTGLAYRFRCDSYGWTMVLVDLGEWTVNPKLADTLFEPPAAVPAGGDPPPAAGDPSKAAGTK